MGFYHGNPCTPRCQAWHSWYCVAFVVPNMFDSLSFCIADYNSHESLSFFVYICMCCLNSGFVPRAGFWMLLMTHTGPIACSFNSSRVVQSHDCLYRLPSLCFFVGMYILDFHILLGMQISYFPRSCSTTMIYRVAQVLMH